MTTCCTLASACSAFRTASKSVRNGVRSGGLVLGLETRSSYPDIRTTTSPSWPVLALITSKTDAGRPLFGGLSWQELRTDPRQTAPSTHIIG